MPVTELLMVTVAVPDPERTAKAWSDASGYELLASDPVEQAVPLWPYAPLVGVAVTTGVPGVPRGLVRFVQAGAPAPTGGTVTTTGPVALEFFCRDVDAVHATFAGNDAFRPTGNPMDYDLTHIGSGVARSMHVLGPDDLHLFFTTMRSVPAPRPLPRTPYEVSPVINLLTAAEDSQRAATAALYRDALGIPMRFSGTVADPNVNALLDLPSDWAVEDDVFFVADGQLSEHHFHPSGRLAGRRLAGGAVPAGPVGQTFTVDDLDATAAALGAAGYDVRGPVPVEARPYAGRRTAAVVAPAGEVVEVVAPAGEVVDGVAPRGR